LHRSLTKLKERGDVSVAASGGKPTAVVRAGGATHREGGGKQSLTPGSSKAKRAGSRRRKVTGRKMGASGRGMRAAEADEGDTVEHGLDEEGARARTRGGLEARR
jgi:hypothetical protein